MRSYYLLNRPEILRKARIKRNSVTPFQKLQIQKYNRDYYLKKRRINNQRHYRKPSILSEHHLIKFERKEIILSFD